MTLQLHGNYLGSRAPLDVGDISPDCVLSDLSGSEIDLRDDATAGNIIVILFCPKFSPAVLEALAAFRTHLDAFSAAHARLFAVTIEAAKVARAHDIPFPVMLDRKERVFRDFGANRRELPTTVVLRPNHHVAGVFDGAPETQASAALTVVERLAEGRQPVPMGAHPPVLIIPEVLSQRDCQHLIEVFETRGQRFAEPGPGIDHFGTDYKMRIPEHMREDRIDHWIFDADTMAFLDHRLQRVWPEIHKAFQYRVTKKEALRIGSYQGSRGGYSHGHRDNVPPTTYRRFAMSINLNTNQFEGGELRFPEFGDQRYRPESGAAIVFSSSLLHEAMHVTAGRRLVLLAFLFGEH
jgi:peroxiredoxin